MANPEHLNMLKKDTEIWNKWREENPDIKPKLAFADLGGFGLSGANLKGAMLGGANLQGTWLERANLQCAELYMANLLNAHLLGANLRDAKASWSNIQIADLRMVNLQNSVLSYSNLKGTMLSGAKLQGADIRYAIVDGETIIDDSTEVDRDTNFEGVGLDAMRIDPGIKQLLEYNIRRRKWQNYCKTWITRAIEHLFKKRG